MLFRSALSPVTRNPEAVVASIHIDKIGQVTYAVHLRLSGLLIADRGLGRKAERSGFVSSECAATKRRLVFGFGGVEVSGRNFREQ